MYYYHIVYSFKSIKNSSPATHFLFNQQYIYCQIEQRECYFINYLITNLLHLIITFIAKKLLGPNQIDIQDIFTMLTKVFKWKDIFSYKRQIFSYKKKTLHFLIKE